MRCSIIFLGVLACAAAANAGNVGGTNGAVQTTYVPAKPLVELVELPAPSPVGKNQLLCNLCVQEVLIIINTVLNDILNGVILNSCGKLCDSFHQNATKNICNLACDIIGIKQLVKLLNQTNPDEIYVCDKIGFCLTGNCTGHGDGSTCLSIDSLTAPPSTPYSKPITAEAAITVKEPLATGMTRIRICDESTAKPGKPATCTQSDALNFNWPAGRAGVNINLNGGQDPLAVGKYSASIEVCEGSCGSTKPNSSPYDTKSVKFEVSKSGPPGPGPHPSPSPPAPPAPPGAHHYGDPAKGSCLSDEEKVQINGVKGDFCSPKCSGSNCPADVPDGATASPKCVLETSGSSTPTQCALICSPSDDSKDGSNAACPTGATCKPISGTGLCTYND